ncbi:FUSC family protein [Pusillimonas sp. DMV24BSW_D]|uniref:FUSC family protein n=1 Tax=Neopusillimonas aestuarii TaxID=2716226 RepID=UPI00140BF5EB|nr:FUSC family protein [Pusillimonas sp. DMV24BSW_D]QIM49462.1 FUSC family protein [Pusillimonas sp. DMV24BSW_D]
MLDNIMAGMWVAMGCLMMITGEISGRYRDVYRAMLISALIGSLGYLAGYLHILPWSIVVVMMMLSGAVAQLLSGVSHTLSIAMLQFLLLASIALGVPSINNFWMPVFLYLAGMALYALVLSIEIVICKYNTLQSKNKYKTSKAADQSPKSKSVEFNFVKPSGFQYAQSGALAVCLGIAYGIHWVDDNPHWFWIPLAVGLIMKPDLGPIHKRARQRITGTLLGVILGVLILIVIPKSYAFVLIMAVLAGILPWAMKYSYALQAVFLTPLILMLINIILPGSADINYAIQRLLDTIIGSMIVIAFGYLPLKWYQSKYLKH